jgi:HPt (histidine-containing phosphotransfer) domain-containing protein
MTAHAMEGDRQKCLAAGMDAYVSKPIQTPMLVAALAEVTQGSAGLNATTPPVPDSSRSAGPLFDRKAVLDNLGDDLDLLRTLAQIYIDDLPNGLRVLLDAANGKDSEALLTAAHTLKGAAANFGAELVVAELMAIEQVARATAVGVDFPATLGAQIAAAEELLRQLGEELV